MRKFVLTLLVCALLAFPLLAQTQASQNSDKAAGGPPKVLQIYREEAKAGMSGAHEKTEAAFASALAKAKYPYYELTLTPLSGPNDVWFIVGNENYADITKQDQLMRANKPLQAELDRLSAADGAYINNASSWIAKYDEELSYRPDFKLGDTRYTTVQVFKIKPQAIDSFKELLKTSNAAHAKLNIDEHMLVYEVTFGAPLGTYLVFQPMKSTDEMDSVERTHGAAYREAVGEDFYKKRSEFAQTGLISLDRNMFSINPRMSYVSDEVAAAAPDYWHPKSEIQSASINTKTKKKASPVTPAASKKETTN